MESNLELERSSSEWSQERQVGEDHVDNGCPGIEPCLDSGRNPEAQYGRQWVQTSGKWPSLIAEEGYGFAGYPGSFEEAMFEQPNIETFFFFFSLSQSLF